MTTQNTDRHTAASVDTLKPLPSLDEARPSLNGRNGTDTIGGRLPRLQILKRQGTSEVDVTDLIHPMTLKTTKIVVVINGDTAELEKVILHDSVHQFHLTATAVGVCGQYADGDGTPYPDVWYAEVKPQFRS